MANNLKIPLPGWAKMHDGFQTAVTYTLWALLLFLFIWEAFVIKNSVGIIFSQSSQPAEVATHGAQVRINFTAYNAALDHIQQSESFQPATSTLPNPFQPGQ